MKNKKAEITWRYIVGGIIALLALLILLYLIFDLRGTMIDTFDKIKGLF
tara:strand:- start:215 stop:361 length:147 start_codon:yes stop_codon:yes gene_type:complete